MFAVGRIANAVETCHWGTSGGDGFVSQLCTLLNVEASGDGGRSDAAGKVSLSPKANYHTLVSPSKINER